MKLFNHTHHHSHHTTISHTVTENRAPTDESVKLLREMERKAESEVVQAIPVKNNTLEGLVIQKQFSPLTVELQTTVSFQLNGQRYDVAVEESARLDEEGALRLLARALAEKITMELLAQMTKTR